MVERRHLQLQKRLCQIRTHPVSLGRGIGFRDLDPSILGLEEVEWVETGDYILAQSETSLYLRNGHSIAVSEFSPNLAVSGIPVSLTRTTHDSWIYRDTLIQ